MEENKTVIYNTEENAEEKSIELAVNSRFSREFTKLPMLLRIKYLVDTMANVPEEQISFSRVNTFVHSNISEGDFNIIPEELKTKDDIHQLYSRICLGVAGLATWCKRVCKDCGKEYYLYLSEVDFYHGKNLLLPRRCKNCISEHRQTT